MRMQGGFAGLAEQAAGARGGAWPGLISYGRTGASVFKVLPVRRSDGTEDTTYLDAGRNPPNGVVVTYYLAVAPEGGTVSLTFLDEKERKLRAYEKIPARAGINRFTWNRRIAGVPNVTATDLEPIGRANGPMVVPGRYLAQLTIEGESLTQPFEVLPDPRIKASPAALREQFAFLREIIDKLGATNRMINDLDGLLAQAKLLDRRLAQRKAGSARSLLSKLRDELTGMRGILIDVNYSQAQLWPAGLHEKLNALFDTVDSADFAPARQAREVFAELAQRFDRLVERRNRLQEKSIPALNAALASVGVEAIG